MTSLQSNLLTFLLLVIAVPIAIGIVLVVIAAIVHAIESRREEREHRRECVAKWERVAPTESDQYLRSMRKNIARRDDTTGAAIVAIIDRELAARGLTP